MKRGREAKQRKAVCKRCGQSLPVERTEAGEQVIPRHRDGVSLCEPFPRPVAARRNRRSRRRPRRSP